MKNAAKNAQQNAQQNRQNPAGQRTADRQIRPNAVSQAFDTPEPAGSAPVYDNKTVFTKPVKPYTAPEKSREQLAEEARALMEAISGRRAAESTAQKPPVVKPMERGQRPVMAHAEDDCGGGSIHDGYHEGVSGDPFGEKKPRAAVAGKLGKRLATEDDALEQQKHNAENAKRALARISKLPPIAQGIVYSEILGKPKSEAF